MRWRVLAAAGLALILASCASVEPPPPLPAPAPPPPRSALEALPGWLEDDHAASFAAFVSVCGVSQNPALGEICRRRPRPAAA